MAELNGAYVQDRPSELAGDVASVAEVAEYVLTTNVMDAESFCLLMPNCPLRIGSDILGAFETMATSDADVVMSVVQYGWLRPEWALFGDKGWLKRAPEADAFGPRAGKATLVCPSGAIRWARTQAFHKCPSFYPERLAGFQAALASGDRHRCTGGFRDGLLCRLRKKCRVRVLPLPPNP